MDGRRKKSGTIKSKRNKHGWKGKGETGAAKPMVFACPVRKSDVHTKVEWAKAFGPTRSP
jgi:hypothetical protein